MLQATCLFFPVELHRRLRACPSRTSSAHDTFLSYPVELHHRPRRGETRRDELSRCQSCASPSPLCSATEAVNRRRGRSDRDQLVSPAASLSFPMVVRFAHASDLSSVEGGGHRSRSCSRSSMKTDALAPQTLEWSCFFV
jgi:hypothetical protein